MRIKMITTAAGPDGVYMASREYVVSAEMGQRFVAAGAAECLDGPAIVTSDEPATFVEVEHADAPEAPEARTTRKYTRKG